MSVKGEIVKQYLTDHPDTPSLTLAKKIYLDNPSVFANIDNARTAVRYYRGQSGNKDRRNITDRTHFKQRGSVSPFDDLPEGLTYYEDWQPVYLEDEKTLVLGDVHAPFHDRPALIAALEYGIKHDVDAVLFDGDLFDFFGVSFWEKDPRKRDFAKELDIGCEVLRSIRQAFPDKKIRLKIGNHEERYFRYMAVKAPELIAVRKFDISSILELDEHGIEIINDRKIIRIGMLNVVHGHEFGRTISSPVNPARGLYLRNKENAICAHFHQTSEHAEKSMTDTVVKCWSIGCLCDLHPEYLPINKWNHGFAIVELLEDGEYYVHNKTIIDGKVF